MKQLFRHIPLVILLIISLIACKKTAKFSNGGSLQFDGTSYALQSVRQHVYLDSVSNEMRIELVFCSGKMTYTDAKMSGTGALLFVTVASDTAPITAGEYELLSESCLITISDDKTDTTTTALGSGTFTVENTDHGQRYALKTNTLDATYEGTYTYSYDIDGVQIGTLQIGDSIVPLQRGDLMLWGSIFADDLNYHEFYFYSCNLRHNDAGKIRQGAAFVVGLHSINADSVAAGDYPISTKNEANTALYGHKSGKGNWGTYTINYLSATAQTKTNLLSGKISLTRDGGLYQFTFDGTDQDKNKITGNYNGDFKIYDIR